MEQQTPPASRKRSNHPGTPATPGTPETSPSMSRYFGAETARSKKVLVCRLMDRGHNLPRSALPTVLVAYNDTLDTFLENAARKLKMDRAARKAYTEAGQRVLFPASEVGEGELVYIGLRSETFRATERTLEDAESADRVVRRLSTQATKKVFCYRNGATGKDAGVHAVIMVPPSSTLEAVLDEATKKLKMGRAARRLYAEDGTPVESVAEIKDRSALFVAAAPSEPFKAPAWPVSPHAALLAHSRHSSLASPGSSSALASPRGAEDPAAAASGSPRGPPSHGRLSPASSLRSSRDSLASDAAKSEGAAVLPLSTATASPAALTATLAAALAAASLPPSPPPAAPAPPPSLAVASLPPVSPSSSSSSSSSIRPPAAAEEPPGAASSGMVPAPGRSAGGLAERIRHAGTYVGPVTSTLEEDVERGAGAGRPDEASCLPCSCRWRC
eukprot:tig00000145_g8797.t1